MRKMSNTLVLSRAAQEGIVGVHIDRCISMRYTDLNLVTELSTMRLLEAK